MEGWIGVDLDGTLAEYHGWKGEAHIGKPIPLMVERILKWTEEGQPIKIFTARVCGANDTPVHEIVNTIVNWLLDNGMPILDVVCCKDYGMIELWDDRAVSVEPNTGRDLRQPKED